MNHLAGFSMTLTFGSIGSGDSDSSRRRTGLRSGLTSTSLVDSLRLRARFTPWLGRGRERSVRKSCLVAPPPASTLKSDLGLISRVRAM